MTFDSFEGFGLPASLSACLAQMKYTTPTPIQAKAIPFALDGRDILGSAQTGTGKTAAFSIPMIAALMNNPRACALVLTPTRELAMQVLDVAKQMIARDSGIRTALLIGGDPMGKQFKQLKDRPRLIVGTPGRVNDHLRRNPEMFDMTSFVVLDEADRMLDMGFSVQIDTILDAAPAERQTLMFSATFAPKILKFAQTYLRNPQRVEIESAKTSADNIVHQLIPVTQEAKYDTLRAELETRMGSVIIFVKTKHGADKLAARLSNDEYESAALHGGLNQRQRERTTRQFRAMEYRILVATDVAARGLDIPHVEHVINYDMPMVAEDYIHRIGRTARAGAKGCAVAIVSPQDRGLWADVERLLNPGKPREDRAEGGERKGPRKPFRNKGGFRKDGYGRKPDFKKNDGERQSYGDRPAYNSDRPRGDKPFRKREEGDRQNFEGRSSYNNDRPRGDKPFRKREDGERHSYGERKSFGDRPAYNSDRPRGDKPFRKSEDGERQNFEGRSSYQKRENGNNERDHARSFTEDRPRQGKPFQKRQDGEKRFYDERGPKKFSGGGKPQRSANGEGNGNGKKFAKPFGKKTDKPFDRADKPQGRRDGAPRYDKGGKPGFKKFKAA